MESHVELKLIYLRFVFISFLLANDAYCMPGSSDFDGMSDKQMAWNHSVEHNGQVYILTPVVMTLYAYENSVL